MDHRQTDCLCIVRQPAVPGWDGGGVQERPLEGDKEATLEPRGILNQPGSGVPFTQDSFLWVLNFASSTFYSVQLFLFYCLQTDGSVLLRCKAPDLSVCVGLRPVALPVFYLDCPSGRALCATTQHVKLTFLRSSV